MTITRCVITQKSAVLPFKSSLSVSLQSTLNSLVKCTLKNEESGDNMQNAIAEERIRLSCLMNGTERCAALTTSCELQYTFCPKEKPAVLNPNFVVHKKQKYQLIAVTVDEHDHRAVHRNLPKYNCRHSSVGIAAGQGVAGPGIETLWGWAFPFPPRPTFETYPAFCAVGTWPFLRGAVDHLCLCCSYASAFP